MAFAALILLFLPLALLPDILATDGDDAPDGAPEPTEGGPGTLLPLDEDDAVDPDATDPPAETVLAPDPDTPDIPDFAETESDPLVPLDEIESEADTISVDYAEVTGTGYVEIEDFDADSETLQIVFDEDDFAALPEIEVNPDDDTTEAHVLIDGTLFAVLKDAPDATLGNIDAVLI